MTLAGSGLWNAVLIALGVWLGERHDVVAHYIGQYSIVVYAVIALVMVVVIGSLLVRARRRKQERTQDVMPESGEGTSVGDTADDS